MMNMVSRREKWQECLAAWESSGQTGRRWCRENGVPYPQFAYWRRRLRESECVAEGKGFVEVEFAGNGGISLECGGVKLEVVRGFDRTLLLEIVRTLREA